MLLRFLLNLIKPSNKQLKCKNTKWYSRLHIWLYQMLLKQLLKTYLQYVVSDTVIVYDGRVKIVYEFKDTEFEDELARNKIAPKSEMTGYSLPISIQKRRSKKTCSYFKFKNLLSLYVDGENLSVIHDDTFSIEGTARGKCNCLSGDNYVLQSTIRIISSDNKQFAQGLSLQCQQSIPSDQHTIATQRQKKNKRSQNIFGKEVNISSITHKRNTETDTIKLTDDVRTKSIEKRGFDIDTSF